MALVTIPNTFTPNTIIQSGQVNANFTALANYINAGSVLLGGNGYMILPGSVYVQWGNMVAAKMDGSAASTPTFPIAFPNAAYGVFTMVQNAYQSNPWQITEQVTAVTTTGFSYNAAGAPAGSTANVYWLAVGT